MRYDSKRCFSHLNTVPDNKLVSAILQIIRAIAKRTFADAAFSQLAVVAVVALFALYWCGFRGGAEAGMFARVHPVRTALSPAAFRPSL